ncbi:MAG: tryptophan 7-halogenase, partial [Rivularia sp. ALOHA_DT_140]|nr:tryptophan 7-halogenase [Rivularia sp. ALOHA_DT_140]
MYDVIIIGSGLFGSILAAVLARNEAKVLLIDAGKHPRFAVGESTVRDTTKLLKILSQRFDVPELGNISSFVEVNEKVSRNCGLKRNFGFVYHRSQQKQEPQEVYQIVIPDHFEGPEIHFFRQDIDHYLCKVAQKYGATVLEETRISDVNITSEEVTIKTIFQQQFKASYIVDATGYRSVLAQKFSLREETCRFKTHSRSVFTHMKGVKPYEECEAGKLPQVPRKWSQGTLHHCFDGGWIWVIPFNNAPDFQNPLTSVGLQLDSRKYPFAGTNPQAEWNQILSQFPSIAEQFEEATPVKPWISTGSRLQYSSSQTVGKRYCLAAHAAGFIDPLYSRGLPLSLNSLLLLADKLLLAMVDKDFSTERFKDIESYQQKALDNIDALVSGSYTS